MIDIGYYSLPVVGLTAIFTGMVLALQIYTGFSRFDAQSAIATVVVLSMTRELGPVIAGADGRRPRRRGDGGRDRHHARHRADRRADHALDQPVQISGRAAPDRGVHRPADPGARSPTSSASSAAILVATYKLGFNSARLSRATPSTISRTEDVVSGLIKAAVFGFIIALMGCYHGYHSRGGAQGVGAATTNAVVSASILILLVDYVLTSVLFSR